MRNMKSIFGLITLLALMSLTGCGGSGGSGADLPGGSGTAVDPYIEGAVFQEVSADGQTVLQRQSTITNSQGRFVFTKPFTPGSLIVMKPGSTGMHVGKPFQGILKRKVETDDSGELVVSPLTTLLANGMSKADVVSLLGDAGLTGISEADLTTDPMAGLAGQTGTVSDESLYLLHASMAVNTTLDILGNYDADYSTLSSSDGALLLKSMVAVAQETLNKTVYVDVLDPDATAPLQLGDVINASVEFSRAVVTQIKADMANNNGVPNIAMIDDAVLAAPAIHDMVSIHYHDRLGSAPAEIGRAHV